MGLNVLMGCVIVGLMVIFCGIILCMCWHDVVAEQVGPEAMLIVTITIDGKQYIQWTDSDTSDPVIMNVHKYSEGSFGMVKFTIFTAMAGPYKPT
jgi:hypothetical protein